MKIVYCKYLPVKGYKIMNVCGLLIVRKGAKVNETDIRHEAIHTEQMKECFYPFFYLIYVIEWLVRMVCILCKHSYERIANVPYMAYRAISFEQEAYEHEDEEDYLEGRKEYAMWNLY